ncbi:MAG: cysteine hydrolase, partial [Firmicutes bacterium]|nr:cysteine hydrolase [Bacillota bacterium]
QHVPIVYVHVMPFPGAKSFNLTDQSLAHSGPMPANAFDIIDALTPHDNDYLLTKHSRGAFTGTELDQLLRSWKVENIAIGGIATNIGVESTVRVGADLGYNFVVVEDACGGLTPEGHEAALKYSLPYYARIRPLSALRWA